MAALSGQKTVTAAGTAEALGSQPIGGTLAVKALAGNTDIVVVGNDGAGDVTTSNGFELSAGEVIVFCHAGSLAVKALASNTDIVVVGNDGAGDVTTSNGFELSAGEVIVFNLVGNLANIMLDAAVSGEGVCWITGEI